MRRRGGKTDPKFRVQGLWVNDRLQELPFLCWQCCAHGYSQGIAILVLAMLCTWVQPRNCHSCVGNVVHMGITKELCTMSPYNFYPFWSLFIVVPSPSILAHTHMYIKTQQAPLAYPWSNFKISLITPTYWRGHWIRF